jgi:hypothetical protein
MLHVAGWGPNPRKRGAMTELEASGQWSRHGRQRAAQSNLSGDDVDLVRRYGVLEHRTGVRFYFIGRREVERYRHAAPRLVKLHDIVMIVSQDGDTVITVYRNRHALKHIRRKSKINFRAAA